MTKTVALEEVVLPDLIAEIETAGTEFIVTRRGVPVAHVMPHQPRRRSLEELRRSVVFIGEIMEPADPSEAWTFDEDNLK